MGGNGWRSGASLFAVVEDADAEPLGLVGEIVCDTGAWEKDDGSRHLGEKRLKGAALPWQSQSRASDQIKSSITVRDTARARLHVLVKKIPRKYGYQPDLQDSAVQTVLQQAEFLSAT